MTISGVYPRRIIPGAGVEADTRRALTDLQDGIADAFRRLQAELVSSVVLRDTALPRLTHVGASTITIAAWPGQPSTVRVTLQDGQQYSFDGTLSWSPSFVGPGGLDTGAEAASTWYYLSLVPVGGVLTVVGSTVSPTTGAGPTGHALHRYVGAVRNDGSSNLTKLYHVAGDHFAWYFGITPASVAAFGTTFQDPAVTASLTDVVPDTCLAAHLNFEIQRDGSGGGWDVSLNLRIDGETSVFTEVFANNLAFNSQYLYTWLPTPTSPKQMGYRSYKTGGSPAIALQDVSCLGWTDGMLAVG